MLRSANSGDVNLKRKKDKSRFSSVFTNIFSFIFHIHVVCTGMQGSIARYAQLAAVVKSSRPGPRTTFGAPTNGSQNGRTTGATRTFGSRRPSRSTRPGLKPWPTSSVRPSIIPLGSINWKIYRVDFSSLLNFESFQPHSFLLQRCLSLLLWVELQKSGSDHVFC